MKPLPLLALVLRSLSAIALHVHHAISKKGIQEALDLSAEHRVEISHLIPSPRVLYPLVGMEEVITDLGTKTGNGFALVL